MLASNDAEEIRRMRLLTRLPLLPKTMHLNTTFRKRQCGIQLAPAGTEDDMTEK
jgi:hypothetical protein